MNILVMKAQPQIIKQVTKTCRTRNCTADTLYLSSSASLLRGGGRVGGRLGLGRQAGRGRAELPVIVLIKLDWDGLEHHPKLP